MRAGALYLQLSHALLTRTLSGPRPRNSILALSFFVARQAQAQIFWLHLPYTRTPSHTGYIDPNVNDLFERFRRSVNPNVDLRPIHKILLRRNVTLVGHCDLKTYTNSVIHATDADPARAPGEVLWPSMVTARKLRLDWHGLVVAYSSVGLNEGGQPPCKDLDEEDLKTIVEFLSGVDFPFLYNGMS